MKNNIIVIFSSHLSEIDNNNFIEHIHNTIGCKHNVVCYPNFNEYSLSEIYNKAIDEHYEENSIFVMCHNDIIIKTRNWGKLLLTKYNSTKYDIIGVAGTTYLPDSGMWWEDKTKMCGIVEHTDGYNVWVSEYSKEFKGKVLPVVLIDGLFISFDPDTIIHKFDDDFKGFHFYDVSFCIPNYLDGCDIGVTTDIRLLHKSMGVTNKQWEKNKEQFIKKYYYELPISLSPYFYDFNIKLTKTPKLSVVIPTKNNFKYIRNNIFSWWDVVKYNNYEIIIADTGSNEEVIKQYDEILNDKIKLVRYDYYNFAKINNDVVNNHISDDTELILFCNDDIILLNDAISRCVQIYNKNKKSVGTIGIRLHYGDGSIQHNGMIVFRNGNEYSISHIDLKKNTNYSTGVNYDAIGNTGGFMFINRDLFFECGCFNENYIECFEDVELNLKCTKMGKKNITVSDAVAYHFESISRKKSNNMYNDLSIDYIKLKKFLNTVVL